MLNRERVGEIKALYPEGTKVELVYMADRYAPKEGTKGTVIHVDDIGQVHVIWDDGSTLALVPGVDEWETISE